MHHFPTSERLKSEKAINRLFKSGNGFMAYPIRVVWDFVEQDTERLVPAAVQVAFSVPKRRFKRAVTRNLIKRRMREAYRLHKSTLLQQFADRPVQMMLIYVAKEVEEYAEIEKGIHKMLRKMEAKLS